MRKLAGPDSQVHFTHLSKSSSESLTTKFTNQLASDGQAGAFCHESGVLELIKERLGGSLDKVCLLDPKAEEELSPEDGEGRFEWFLFGVCSFLYIAYGIEYTDQDEICRVFWVCLSVQAYIHWQCLIDIAQNRRRST